jgi:hypothetical protein
MVKSELVESIFSNSSEPYLELGTSMYGLANLLGSWDFQLFVTLTIGPNDYYGPRLANKLRLWWTRRLSISLRCRLGYFYVFTAARNFAHFHIIMLGARRLDPRFSLNWAWIRNEAVRIWPYIAKAEQIKDKRAVALYMARHMTSPKYEFSEFDFYGL